MYKFFFVCSLESGCHNLYRERAIVENAQKTSIGSYNTFSYTDTLLQLIPIQSSKRFPLNRPIISKLKPILKKIQLNDLFHEKPISKYKFGPFKFELINFRQHTTKQ